ncbi:type II secretion system GspH family protein [Aromatoleum toluvorans]|uniref:type II secretion system GspH family protein n=1 Tax=Aromatoleum toluvorans TaxID=92002 RepID=UPI001B7D1997|nr:type II secretion system GspH family protein [Aromatoleum toluvorans]
MRTGEIRRGCRRLSTAGRAQAGYTYLLVLFIVAGLGLLAAQTGVVWYQAAQRDREADLLAIGAEFARALASYAKASHDHALPQNLQQLVEDKRGPVMVRHLRRIYRDPFTGKPEWGLEKAGGRIAGVYSLGKGGPIRQHDLPKELGGITGEVKSYAEWIFRPPETEGEAAVTPAAAGAAPAAGLPAGNSPAAGTAPAPAR